MDKSPFAARDWCVAGFGVGGNTDMVAKLFARAVLPVIYKGHAVSASVAAAAPI